MCLLWRCCRYLVSLVSVLQKKERSFSWAVRLLWPYTWLLNNILWNTLQTHLFFLESFSCRNSRGNCRVRTHCCLSQFKSQLLFVSTAERNHDNYPQKETSKHAKRKRAYLSRDDDDHHHHASTSSSSVSFFLPQRSQRQRNKRIPSSLSKRESHLNSQWFQFPWGDDVHRLRLGMKKKEHPCPTSNFYRWLHRTLGNSRVSSREKSLSSWLKYQLTIAMHPLKTLAWIVSPRNHWGSLAVDSSLFWFYSNCNESQEDSLSLFMRRLSMTINPFWEEFFCCFFALSEIVCRNEGKAVLIKRNEESKQTWNQSTMTLLLESRMLLSPFLSLLSSCAAKTSLSRRRDTLFHVSTEIREMVTDSSNEREWKSNRVCFFHAIHFKRDARQRLSSMSLFSETMVRRMRRRLKETSRLRHRLQRVRAFHPKKESIKAISFHRVQYSV